MSILDDITTGETTKTPNSQLPVAPNSLSTEVRQTTTQIQKKEGKFFQLFSALNSDLIFGSVAVGCILGVILFYFQGLQPILLSNYITQTQKQVVQLQSAFINQIQSVDSYHNDMLKNFSYRVGQTCNEIQNYSSLAQDRERIDRLKVGLLDKQELKEYPATYRIYDSPTKSIYTDVYNTYSSMLKNVRGNAESYQNIPQYLNYRNNWLDACRSITDSQGEIPEIKTICQNLIDSFNNYKSSPTPKFWESVQPLYQKSTTLCEPIIQLKATRGFYTQFTTWKSDWLENIDQILSFTPPLSDEMTTLQKYVVDFTQEAEIAITKLDNLYLDRLEFVNLWYFLQLE